MLSLSLTSRNFSSTNLTKMTRQKFNLTVRAEFLCLLIVFAFFSFFCTYGSFDVIEHDPQGLGPAYDSMATNLLSGSVAVDPQTIQWETFSSQGAFHMYFGPWPSLLRVPLQVAMPQLSGQWTRLSILTASMLSALCAFLLIKRALDKNASLTPTVRTYWLILTTLGFTLASPLLFITASPAIYHEASVWGLAGSLGAMLFPNTVLGACASGAAILSRFTFGIPYIIVHFAFLVSALRKRARPLQLALILPILTAMGVQGGFNYLRFGSPLTFQDLDKYSAIWDSKPYHTGIVHGNFHLSRIPDNLYAYFGPKLECFSKEFPFIHFSAHTPFIKKVFGWAEPTLPLWIGSGAILLLATVGLFTLRKNNMQNYEWWLLLGLLIQCLFVLSVWCSTQRYTLDFIPLLLFLGLKGLSHSALIVKKTTLLVFTGLVALGILITALTSYTWTSSLYSIPTPYQKLKLSPTSPQFFWWQWPCTDALHRIKVQNQIKSWKKALHGSPEMDNNLQPIDIDYIP